MSTQTLNTPYIRRAGGDASIWYVGHFFTFLAESRDTNGQFSLIDAAIRQGLEPPPHTHQHEDETYYILEGNITFTVGEQTFMARPGDLLFLPRGVQHGFRLTTPQARALIWINPAGLEAAFREMGEPAQALSLPPLPAGPPDIPRMLAVFGQRGIQFAPPPDTP
jgi:quercetin dioxygenase-like cupin family protein